MVPSIFRKRHEAVDITPMPGPLEAAAAASSGVDTLEHLKQFEKAHKLDPNLPIDDLTDVDAAIATGNAEKGIEIEHALMEDNSPYPEVCARPPAARPRRVPSAERVYFAYRDPNVGYATSQMASLLCWIIWMDRLID